MDITFIVDLNVSFYDIFLLSFTLISAGLVAGLLAGLFGVGGGAVMVPVLYEVFYMLSVPENLRMQLAIGTSLAVIIPTSIRSYRAHLKSGLIDRALLKNWSIPIILGVIIGALLARHAPSTLFKVIFIGVAMITAAKLLWHALPSLSKQLPSKKLFSFYGLLIGFLSSMMGIGGGTLSNMVLSLHNISIHRSIALSSGVGVLISVPATLGYLYAGWPVTPLLPPLSLGYISVIGFILLTPTAFMTAPLGAKIAHKLPRNILQKAFAIFLILVSFRFILTL